MRGLKKTAQSTLIEFQLLGSLAGRAVSIVRLGQKTLQFSTFCPCKALSGLFSQQFIEALIAPLGE